jgi:hypothetical protein
MSCFQPFGLRTDFSQYMNLVGHPFAAASRHFIIDNHSHDNVFNSPPCWLSLDPNTMSEYSSFMRLPLELRELVYSHYFVPDKVQPDDCGGGKYIFQFELLRVCRRIYLEAQTVWRRENVFVRIETPWPQAGMWIFPSVL